MCYYIQLRFVKRMVSAIMHEMPTTRMAKKASGVSAKGRGTFMPNSEPSMVGTVRITVSDVRSLMMLLRLFVTITV